MRSFLFGALEGTRLSHCGARSGSALNVARTFIHSLAASSPFCFMPIKNTTARVVFFMARWKGLEPLTYWFVASYSIQLSYQRISDC